MQERAARTRKATAILQAANSYRKARAEDRETNVVCGHACGFELRSVACGPQWNGKDHTPVPTQHTKKPEKQAAGRHGDVVRAIDEPHFDPRALDQERRPRNDYRETPTSTTWG